MIIKREFSEYNPRRYRTPWGAKITFRDGIKPVYDFTGHWDGCAVLIHASEGDILAFGQKDTRGNSSCNMWYRVDAAGGLTPVTQAQARESVQCASI